jgi:hypothetical protein
MTTWILKPFNRNVGGLPQNCDSSATRSPCASQSRNGYGHEHLIFNGATNSLRSLPISSFELLHRIFSVFPLALMKINLARSSNFLHAIESGALVETE